MKTNLKFLLLSFCVICTLCNVLVCCTANSEYIQVCYYDDGRENISSVSPDSFKNSFVNYKADTFYIQNDVFDSIWNGFKVTKIKNRTFEPDTRFCVTCGEKQFFIDYFFYAYDENYDSVAVSRRTIYLLRSSSGYYNRIPLEDLDYNSEIKEFGIPKDYHYSQPLFSDCGCKKVLLFKK